MAKDVTSGTVWIFDTVGDMEGLANFSDNPTAVNFNTDIYVQYIKFINPSTATNTTFEVVQGAPSSPTDSDTLTGAIQVAAGEEQDVWIGHRVEGLYLLTIPTSGKVLIYHGYP